MMTTRTRLTTAGKKRLRRVCAVLVLMAWGGAAAAAAPAADLLDRVLAVVSGSIITLSDARTAVELGFVDARAARDPVAVALTWLIERRLVLDEATRYDAVDPDIVGVEAMLVAVRQRYASDAGWEAAKRRLGLTDDAIRTLIGETLHAQQFVDRRFDAQALPSDADLMSFFDRHRAEFVRDGRPLTFEDARARLEALVQRERKTQAVREWIARLRRRAEVSELYTPAR